MKRALRLSGMIVLVAALAGLAGCSTVRLEARPNIPDPLVTKIPVSIGLMLPIEFRNYVYKGERYGFDWEVALGTAQTDGVTRLLNAMFERVVPVDSPATALQADSSIRAVLEPAIEDFSFVTPRDAGTQFYAVSIKYRVSVYTPDGRLAESWPFTGYGIVPSSGMTAQKPLAEATAMAMRDAAAKLAVEFRDQAVVRSLLPATGQPDTLGAVGSEAGAGTAGDDAAGGPRPDAAPAGPASEAPAALLPAPPAPAPVAGPAAGDPEVSSSGP